VAVLHADDTVQVKQISKCLYDLYDRCSASDLHTVSRESRHVGAFGRAK